MLQRRQHADHKWIFNLLAGQATDEEVFVENEQWMLCRDRHPGPEDRFLVVFKDTSLYTLRELDSTHVRMLVQVQNACRKFLRETYQNDPHTQHTWRLYFNYMPSVLQLHLHVARCTSHCSTRIQPLGCVIRNIRDNPGHYASALIMTCGNKSAEHGRTRYRSACTHNDSPACTRNGCWRDARHRPPSAGPTRPLRANRPRARTSA
jgi:diadenosine tetraphosphate (Ap4A) HIT family hydrolase